MAGMAVTPFTSRSDLIQPNDLDREHEIVSVGYSHRGLSSLRSRKAKLGKFFKLLRIRGGTLPRDIRALSKLLILLYRIRKAQFQNLSVPKIFQQNVYKHPDKIAFYYEEQKWTFQEVEDYSNRIANYFKSLGLKKGDCVSLFMENRVEYVCIWLGLAKIGVIPALINYNLRLAPLKHCITIADSKLLVYGAELQEAVDEVLPEIGIDAYVSGTVNGVVNIRGAKHLDEEIRGCSIESPPDINDINFTDKLVYIYTSGTTGMPKAAIIKHSRAYFAVQGMTLTIGLTESDIIYSALPLYHLATGILGCGQSFLMGITVVLRKKFSSSNFMKDCVNYNATVRCQFASIGMSIFVEVGKHDILYNTLPLYHTVGGIIGIGIALLQGGTLLRLMFGNGMRPEIWQQFQSRFNIPKICEFYGATEVNIDGKPGAVGFVSVIVPSAYPCTLIRVDESGTPLRDENGVCIKCKPGEPGEFVGKIIRNDPVREFHGYADKKATKKKISNDVFKKGDSAFMSGDILVMDEEGYLYFKDRTGDTFRWKGENVSTTEVEGIISKVAGLTDAVVYGVEVPGAEGRAGMAAILDPEGTLDMEALVVGFMKALPAYARPLFIRIVTKLDMTGTYKLKKLELQKDGYNINVTKDLMYFFDAKSGGYIPISQNLYDKLLKSEVRL